MGKLMKLETWRKKQFAPEDIPARSTVLKWLANGDLAGKRIGGSWYIDVETESKTTGDDLVDRVLQAAE